MLKGKDTLDKVSHIENSSCPITKIGQCTEDIKKLVLNFLGKPNKKHKNILLTIEGKSITSITNLLSTLLENNYFNIIEINEIKFSSYNNLNGNNTSQSHNFSQLGSLIIEYFLIYFSGSNSMNNGVINMDNINNEDTLNLLLLALQSYDALFIGLIQNSSGDIEKYKNNTPKIRKIALELATLPDLFQQYIIKDFSHSLNFEKIYESLPRRFKDTLNVDDLIHMYPELVLTNIIEDGGKYGECPAKKDNSLIEIFRILNILYGKVYISNLGSKIKE